MFNGVIYFKGFIVRDENGELTNHLLFSINALEGIDAILEDHNLGIEDINIIDFR